MARKKDVDPEKALWLSVLIQALKDLFIEKYAGPARGWIWCKDIRVGSFLWVCQILDLNPEKLRNRVAKLRG
jgi:hypothetical protein